MTAPAAPELSVVTAHIREAVMNASLEATPGAHMVVTDLLPPELYAFLLDRMPPPEGFDYADEHKQNFDPSLSTLAPERSVRAWRWFEHDVVGAILAPLIVDRFRASIETWYRQLFGPASSDDALALRQGAFRSRLMLRRPGYKLKPHRDTKIATVTGLIYFARPGDSPDFGTELYRVEDDRLAPAMRTFYPEKFGGRSAIVKTVPFLPNSALFFLNASGMAHGAHIPRESTQTERYAYQFYIGPSEPELGRLVRRMPPEQQEAWAGVDAQGQTEY